MKILPARSNFSSNGLSASSFCLSFPLLSFCYVLTCYSYSYPFEANTWETLEQLNLSNHQIFIKALEQGASKEGIILEEEQLKWNEPVYLSEAVKAGWGPDGKFTKP